MTHRLPVLCLALSLLLAGCGGARDRDGDGVPASDDCDDRDASAGEAATWYIDRDLDGFGELTGTVACSQPAGGLATGTDCDDGNPTIHPDAAELCDDIDQDCDGVVDDGAPSALGWYVDGDGDGEGAGWEQIACQPPEGTVGNAADCDDTDATLNADTVWHADRDSDGYGDPANTSVQCEQPSGYLLDASDCDDTEAGLSPDTIWYADGDGDGYGDAANTMVQCVQPSGYLLDNSDCDDSNADSSHDTDWYADADSDGYGDPTARVTTQCEQPPGMVADDSDCDDTDADRSPDTDWYVDVDRDGYGDPSSTPTKRCQPPSGMVADDTDCDDTDPGLSPATIWYADVDGDGYGDAPNTLVQCEQPSGYLRDATDCDDTNADKTPNTAWYEDGDGDGYGDPASTFIIQCDQPPGKVADDTDCDDTDADLSPDTDWYTDDDGDGYGDPASSPVTQCEQPSGMVVDDTDCDDTNADQSPETVWYDDDDGDGYGDLASTRVECEQPSGSVADYTDCDDSNPDASPGGVEPAQCDDVDNDCDDEVDEGAIEGLSSWYLDEDGDGDGVAEVSVEECRQPTGTADNGDDCDDDDPTLNSATVWYLDVDGDGYGGGLTLVQCEEPAGYTQSGQDCDDADSATGPDVEEVPDDGIDNNCDGYTDQTAPLSLASADVELVGEAEGNRAGCSVSGAGDVNADGYADLLVGARGYSDGGSSAGAAYLVLGSPSLVSMSLSAADVQLTGVARSDGAGASVTGAGDVNADGYDDLLVGAHWAQTAYLVLGSPSPVSLSLSAADALFTGGELAGFPVSGAGDVNADGFADLLVGSRYDNDGGRSAGAAYLILGSATPTSLSLSAADAQLRGQKSDLAGSALSGAGDVNADGHADILVGAYSNDDGGFTAAGAVYLVLGSPSPVSLDLAGADVQLTGDGWWEFAGHAVAGAGDVNDDGYGDILVGAEGNDDTGTDAGAAYLVLGSLSPVSLSLSAADAQFTGEAEGDDAGSSVSGAGDVNADGYYDLLVGAPANNYGDTEAGSAYLVLGSPSPASLNLVDADMQFFGAGPYDGAGIVTGAGDVDADGLDDLLVGAHNANSDFGRNHGAAYLLLGSLSW
jgi:Putative metal-binding motif/FG-GAP repeat